MTAVSMNTAQAVVSMLRLHGIERLFCVPGVQNDAFFDALYDAQDAIRPIHVRHEQAAAYMALGAALASGRPQAYCVVPGPGFLNTTAALSTAYAANAKVLALLGQIPHAWIGRNFGQLHEIPDQLGVLARLTKWAARVESPADAPGLAHEAFRQMLNGRPRPVGLEVPMDVWSWRAPLELPPVAAVRVPPPVDDDAVERAARLLGAAERPMIVVGGGALDAPAEVRRVAEMLQAPVLAWRSGRGVLDSRHPLSIAMPHGHRLWPQTDAVLAVGTRLYTQQAVWGADDALKVVRIDLDPTEIHRLRPAAVGIVGDAAPTLAALAERLPRHNRARDDRGDEMRTLKAYFDARFARLAPQLAWLDAIRAALPEEGIFLDELTQIGYVSRFAFPVYRPRTFLSTAYQGTLGWGFAAGLGARLERPDVPVVSIAGDGGFMFNVQELASAVRHRIGLVTVVFSDDAYGNVRRIQLDQYHGRTIASDLANPDFVRLGESFGVASQRVDTPDALRVALERAFASGAPALIEVPVGDMPDPWEFINMPRVRPARG